MSKITTTEIKGKKDNSTPTQTKSNVSIIEVFERIGHWAEGNAMALVIAFTGVVLMCMVAVGVSIVKENSIKNNFAMAYSIENKFIDLVTAAEAEELNNPDSPTTSKPAVTFTSEKINEFQPEVLEFVKANPNTDAARNLAIKWVSKLYDVKDYENALEVMNQLKPSKDSLSGLALLLKGTTLMQAGQSSEAVTVFKEILKQKNWAFVHPEATYQMSLAQLNANDADAAIASLKSIQDNYQDNKEAVGQATKVMRWLQYQKSQQN